MSDSGGGHGAASRHGRVALFGSGETSRVGRRVHELLLARLPPTATVLGIDEHTACVLDLAADLATVHSHGTVTICRGPETTLHPSGASFSLAALHAG